MDVIILLFLESSMSELVIGYVFPTVTNDFKVNRNKNDPNEVSHISEVLSHTNTQL